LSHNIMTPCERRRGFLSILVAAISWGTIGVTTQALYRTAMTNAVSIGFFRLAIAAPLLSIACWILLGKRLFRIARRDLALMTLLGSMQALYQVCYFTAISLSGVAVSTLVTLCTAPVLVALLSVFVSRERLSLVVGCALLSAVGGTWLLVGARGSSSGTASSMLGILFALGSGLGYALVILCARSLSSKYHPLHINAIAFTAGALLLFGFALKTGLYVAYPFTGWLMLGYLGAVPTALAYGLFMQGMRSTPSTIASILTLFEPLTATILAWIFLGERLGPSGLLGACLLIAAILLLSFGKGG
jgi:drug/metabolite transporter, DME family